MAEEQLQPDGERMSLISTLQGLWGGQDMRPGRFVGDVVFSRRGQSFAWTGEAWLWLPEVSRAINVATVAASVKRGPDSELTRARKRIASAKRYGNVPSVADVDLVASVAGAASADNTAE